MITVTLKIDESILDKFLWLMGRFSKNEVELVDKILSEDFDYMDPQELESLMKLSDACKSGNKADFVEYNPQ